MIACFRRQVLSRHDASRARRSVLTAAEWSAENGSGNIQGESRSLQPEVSFIGRDHISR